MTIFNRIHNTLKCFSVFVLIISSISCAQSPESLTKGNWVLEKIYADGVDIFEEEVSTNMVVFKEDEVFRSPQVGERLSKLDLTGTWSIDDATNQITLNNRNEYFNGTFDICFKWHKNNGNLLMILNSTNIRMELVRIISPSQVGTILPIKCEDGT